MAEGVGNAPTSAMPILFSRQVQPACICLPSKNGCRTWTRTKTSGLTGRRATFTLSGNGAAGRIPTCIVPFRRRMPRVFDHGSNLKWSARQDLHLRSLDPEPSMLLLHYALVAPANGWRRGLVSVEMQPAHL